MFDFAELAGMGKKGYAACVAEVARFAVNEEADAFANGDFWNNGKGWVGMELDSSNSTTDSAQRATSYTKRVFTPVPVIPDILRRHANGLIAQPYVSSAIDDLSSETAETKQEVLLELETIQREWAAKRDITMPASRAIMSSLYAGDTEKRQVGRGLVRFRIPPSYLVDGRMARQLDFAEAMSVCRLEFLDARTAVVLDMSEAMQDGSIHLYQTVVDGKKKKMVEYSYIDAVETVGADGAIDTKLITRIFQMDEEGRQVNPDGWAYDFNGRLLTFQITHELLIDDAMVQLQKVLNLAKTAEASNLNLGGWVHEFIMNAMPPGRWLTNADGTPYLDKHGQPVFEMDPVTRGASMVTYAQGITMEGGEGQGDTLASPSRQRDLPVSPATFIEVIDGTTAIMLRQAGQAHLNTASGNSSGIALTFQRRDYYIALSSSKTQVDMMLKWIMETAVVLAGEISGDRTYANVRLNVESVLDTGVITAAELKTLAEIYGMDMLSLRTILQLGGFDPTQEMEALGQEQARREQGVLPETDTASGDGSDGEAGGVGSDGE